MEQVNYSKCVKSRYRLYKCADKSKTAIEHDFRCGFISLDIVTN